MLHSFQATDFHVILLIYVKVQVIKGPIVYKGERLLVMKTVQIVKMSWFVKTLNILNSKAY